MNPKPGDVVQLKSGGPKMTIDAVLVEVVWFDDNGQPAQHGTFRVDELVKVE